MNWKKATIWEPLFAASNQSFRHLNQLFDFSSFTRFPTVQELNHLLAPTIRRSLHNRNFCFISPAQQDPHLYYEAQVHFLSQVPTRLQSWHDFFGALIWSLFPQTKNRLNHQHMADINEFGGRNRTSRRDRLTHFDESGVVIAYHNRQIRNALLDHDWRSAFVESRWEWGRQINAYIFGHGLYELLLTPYIGLTGKMFALEVDSGFFTLPLPQQYILLDDLLSYEIEYKDSFQRKGVLTPLPILGVPHFFAANENPEFYDNSDYFRRKKSKT